MIDTHTHLNDPKFEPDLVDVIARARDAGVDGMVVCGFDLESSRAAVDMAGRFEGVYATVGIHPHDAKHCTEDALREIAELTRGAGVIAIGEIGLDFHYDFSPRADQFAAFERQIELARQVGLPMVVHSRESNPEVLEILNAAEASAVGAVFHCFSGDRGFAEEVLDAGLYIGVDGPVTFKASEELREVVRACPLDRLLIETDCPYLSPIPHRGKRNEPAYVALVAQEIARVRGISVEEVDQATTENATRLFARIQGGPNA